MNFSLSLLLQKYPSTNVRSGVPLSDFWQRKSFTRSKGNLESCTTSFLTATKEAVCLHSGIVVTNVSIRMQNIGNIVQNGMFTSSIETLTLGFHKLVISSTSTATPFYYKVIVSLPGSLTALRTARLEVRDTHLPFFI